MRAKQQQSKHWANSKFASPHKTTLSSFVARSAMIGALGILHLFTREKNNEYEN